MFICSWEWPEGDVVLQIRRAKIMHCDAHAYPQSWGKENKVHGWKRLLQKKPHQREDYRGLHVSALCEVCSTPLALEEKTKWGGDEGVRIQVEPRADRCQKRNAMPNFFPTEMVYLSADSLRVEFRMSPSYHKIAKHAHSIPPVLVPSVMEQMWCMPCRPIKLFTCHVLLKDTIWLSVISYADVKTYKT